MKKKNNKINRIVFFVESRDKYFFKYYPDELFCEAGEDATLPHFFIRKIIRKIGRKNPNSLIFKVLCNIFVPRFYPKKCIEMIRSSKYLCFFDSCAFIDLVGYAKNHCCSNISVFAWNPIDENFSFITKMIKKEKYYSYARGDAQKYGIEYIPEPLHVFSDLIIDPDKANYKYDLYFLGRLKGREKIIIDLFSKLSEAGLIVRADLLDDGSNFEELKKYPFVNFLDSFIPYEDYIKNIALSKCLLEISYDKNPNITWRIFEGFAYKRKVLTNNPFAKTEPYFDSNYLICDFDKLEIEQIKEFLSKNYDLSKRKDDLWNHSVDTFVETIYKKMEKEC